MFHPFRLSLPLSLSSPSTSIVCQAGKRRKSSLEQQCLLPPVRQGTRRQLRNQPGAHVSGYCALLRRGLPALACFLAEVIVRSLTPHLCLWGGNAHMPSDMGTRVECSHTLSSRFISPSAPRSFPFLRQASADIQQIIAQYAQYIGSSIKSSNFSSNQQLVFGSSGVTANASLGFTLVLSYQPTHVGCKDS